MYRTFGAEELPASVTLVCDVCGRPVTTRLSGNTTRCPKRTGGCGNPITVPTGSTRPPVTVDCYECSHQWDTRAREGTTVRCPECSHPRRVPTGARDRIDPGAPRAARATAPARPAPRDYRPESGRGLFGALADLFQAGNANPGTRRIDCLHCGHLWRTAAAPGNAIRCPECGRARRIPTGTTRRPSQPRTQATAPAPRPIPPTPRIAPARTSAPRPAPVQAPAPRTGPIDPQTLPLREQNRRDHVCQLVRSLSGGAGLLVWYNQPPGACEALDTTLPTAEQRCPRPVAVAVQFRNGPTEAPAYACLTHGPRLAFLAEGSPYITATVFPLR